MKAGKAADEDEKSSDVQKKGQSFIFLDVNLTRWGKSLQ
jgi:hypothetical protein